MRGNIDILSIVIPIKLFPLHKLPTQYWNFNTSEKLFKRLKWGNRGWTCHSAYKAKDIFVSKSVNKHRRICQCVHLKCKKFAFIIQFSTNNVYIVCLVRGLYQLIHVYYERYQPPDMRRFVPGGNSQKNSIRGQNDTWNWRKRFLSFSISIRGNSHPGSCTDKTFKNGS